MVGGQMLDMRGEGLELDLSQLAKIHENKTGKLLTFPFVAAGIVAQQEDRVMENLQEAGRLIGLAFQVRDDILDVTADFESLGKRLEKMWSLGNQPTLLFLVWKNHMPFSRNH